MNSEKEGNVFVYGKQVDDFHTVDYEAIAMLNVSATQELLKRIKQLEVENMANKKVLLDVLSRVDLLEASN